MSRDPEFNEEIGPRRLFVVPPIGEDPSEFADLLFSLFEFAGGKPELEEADREEITISIVATPMIDAITGVVGPLIDAVNLNS